MAGGQGVRLRPLTDTVPKPMLRVAGRPILERTILHLVGSGITRISISVNYLGHVIEEHFQDGSRFGARIDYLREDEPLGTAGALGLLPEPPTEPVLLMNGDLVTSADVGGLLDAHAQARAPRPRSASGATSTPSRSAASSATAIGSSASSEKPTVEREVNSGIYALSPVAVARVAPRRAAVDARAHRRPPRRRAAGRRRSRSRTTGSTSASASSSSRARTGADVAGSLQGVSCLVTGADGFIGSHLVERLVARGRRGPRVLPLQLARIGGLAGRPRRRRSGPASTSSSATSATPGSSRRRPRTSRSCSTSPR